MIGNGNVALDVAAHAREARRRPAAHRDPRQRRTRASRQSPVTDVHVFGRRGPTQVKFTPLELRELGELRDVDMIVYDEDFDYDEASQGRDREQQAGHRHRPGAAASGASARSAQASRRLHLHFYAKPLEIVGGRRRARRRHSAGSAPRPTARAASSAPARSASSPMQAVYRAVGYFGSPLPGIPFDEKHGVIPNHEGQVLRKESQRAACPASTRPAGSSAARSASSATPSPTRWRPSARHQRPGLWWRPESTRRRSR